MEKTTQKKQQVLKKKKDKYSIPKIIGFSFMCLLLFLLILIPVKNHSKTLNIINGGGNENYHAVFLDNEQVYFGKIEDSTLDFIKLNDIYYLKVNTGLQEGETEGYQGDLSLVKLGEELHGPTDGMRINLNHVMFIEELKEDSKITQAISEHSN